MRMVFSLVSASIAVTRSFSFSGSTLAVASSRMMTGESFIMARAMEMRCFSPPEREAPPSPITVSYPSGSAMIKSWQHAFFAASTTFSMGASSCPNRILLATVSWNRYTFWKTKLKFFIRLSMLYSRTSVPPSRMHPRFTSQNREIRWQSVVLPPPLGPTIAVDVRSGIWTVIPSIIFLLS